MKNKQQRELHPIEKGLISGLKVGAGIGAATYTGLYGLGQNALRNRKLVANDPKRAARVKEILKLKNYLPTVLKRTGKLALIGGGAGAVIGGIGSILKTKKGNNKEASLDSSFLIGAIIGLNDSL